MTADVDVTAEFAADPTTAPTTTVSGVPSGWSRVPVTLQFTATPAAGCTIDHTEYRYGTLDSTTARAARSACRGSRSCRIAA